MSEFLYSIEENEDGLVLKLSGSIDEDVTLDSLGKVDAKKLIIDFKLVNAINSCGIREWVSWITQFDSSTDLVFKNCPKVVVDQMNMVSDFLPEHAEVESFYVPYYSEESDAEKMILFSKGNEYSEGRLFPPQNVKDEETGEAMEIDVIEAKYFRFLKVG